MKGPRTSLRPRVSPEAKSSGIVGRHGDSVEGLTSDAADALLSAAAEDAR